MAQVRRQGALSVAVSHSETSQDQPRAAAPPRPRRAVLVLGGGGMRGFTHIGDANTLWSFDGPGSDGPGTYGDSGNDVFFPWKTSPKPSGMFTLTFSNDWLGDENPNQYDNVEVRFYTLIPAPGVVGVLVLGGVVRRRRRLA